MSYFLRRCLLGIAFAVLVYAGWVVYSGVSQLQTTLSTVRPFAILLALGLSSLNYALRFWKWELCLNWLNIRPGTSAHPGIELSTGHSALIYLAGLSMSVTPGKVGEVLRSTLLKATHGVEFARTAPIVLADRLTDLIALVLLSCLGLSLAPETLPWLGVAATLIVLGIVVLGSPRRLHRLLDLILARLSGKPRDLLQKARSMIDSAAQLLALPRLLALTVLSVVGWGLECVGYAVILEGFPEIVAPLLESAFLWSSTTLIGALSFLPGGLGATEYSLGVLAKELIPGVTAGIAMASTLLIRGATLWFGEVVGALCLAILMRDPRVRNPPPQDSK